MDLAGQYREQTRWRRWDQAMSALPLEPGQFVLDLGCAIGEQAALLARRGARVIGIDRDPDLLAIARGRRIPGSRFLRGDLRHPEGLDIPTVDGIWCSFGAAYHPRLDDLLRAWTAHLRPGGWIALLEVDDLFAHEPLQPETRRLLQDYGHRARREGRHDFRSGRNLGPALGRLGSVDRQEQILDDDELCFQGAAPEAILAAWAQRLQRMTLLQEFAGERYADLRDDFLGCLASPAHTCACRVIFVVGNKPVTAG